MPALTQPVISSPPLLYPSSAALWCCLLGVELDHLAGCTWLIMLTRHVVKLTLCEAELSSQGGPR